MNRNNQPEELNQKINPLNYSGYSLNSDLQCEKYVELFKFLEGKQDFFLEENKEQLESKYFEKWPKKTLEWWSRIWEYPYIYYNILQIIRANPTKKNMVMDFGSGINFFPFAVSETVDHLVCYDNDALCIDNLNSIISSSNTKNVTAILAKELTTEFQNDSFDIIYSVSVLEHITELITILSELKRILKPGGHLLLTFDISVNDTYDLNSSTFKEFWSFVEKNFSLVNPNRNFHINDILTSSNSPLPMPALNPINLFKLRIKEFFKEIFSSNNALKYNAPNLSVQGIVLKNEK